MCNVANCTYSLCMKRRLLPRGICGETVKRQTVERDLEDMIDEPVRLKGKTFRKLGERELY
jgi:hypothetical protein